MTRIIMLIIIIIIIISTIKGNTHKNTEKLYLSNLKQDITNI